MDDDERTRVAAMAQEELERYEAELFDKVAERFPAHDSQRSLTLVRADDPGGHGTDPVTMDRQTLKRIDDAVAGFFARAKRGKAPGVPRFQSFAPWRSFGLLEATGLRHVGDRIRLKGMDRPIRLNHDRPLPDDARILGVTFTKVGRHW